MIPPEPIELNFGRGSVNVYFKYGVRLYDRACAPPAVQHPVAKDGPTGVALSADLDGLWELLQKLRGSGLKNKLPGFSFDENL